MRSLRSDDQASTPEINVKTTKTKSKKYWDLHNEIK
jgi:hypothetical protein